MGRTSQGHIYAEGPTTVKSLMVQQVSGFRPRASKGERTGTGTAAEAVTRRGAQGRAAEADGRQVRVSSRWAVLCTRRGGGERVKIERTLKINFCVWGVVSK